jgi:hypothetical protein
MAIPHVLEARARGASRCGHGESQRGFYEHGAEMLVAAR